MIALYVIYGLLIATAIFFIPLRIRNRRRILREINSLRLKYNEDISQLIRIIEGEAVAEFQEVEQPKPDIIWRSRLLDTFSDEIKRAHDDVFFYVCDSLGELKESKEAIWQSLWQYAGQLDDWVSATEEVSDIHDIKANVTRILIGRSEFSSSPFGPLRKGAWAYTESAIKKSSHASDIHRNRLLEKVT